MRGRSILKETSSPSLCAFCAYRLGQARQPSHVQRRFLQSTRPASRPPAEAAAESNDHENRPAQPSWGRPAPVPGNGVGPTAAWGRSPSGNSGPGPVAFGGNWGRSIPGATGTPAGPTQTAQSNATPGEENLLPHEKRARDMMQKIQHEKELERAERAKRESQEPSIGRPTGPGPHSSRAGRVDPWPRETREELASQYQLRNVAREKFLAEKRATGNFLGDWGAPVRQVKGDSKAPGGTETWGQLRRRDQPVESQPPPPSENRFVAGRELREETSRLGRYTSLRGGDRYQPLNSGRNAQDRRAAAIAINESRRLSAQEGSRIRLPNTREVLQRDAKNTQGRSTSHRAEAVDLSNQGRIGNQTSNERPSLQESLQKDRGTHGSFTPESVMPSSATPTSSFMPQSFIQPSIPRETPAASFMPKSAILPRAAPTQSLTSESSLPTRTIPAQFALPGAPIPPRAAPTQSLMPESSIPSRSIPLQSSTPVPSRSTWGASGSSIPLRTAPGQSSMYGSFPPSRPILLQSSAPKPSRSTWGASRSSIPPRMTPIPESSMPPRPTPNPAFTSKSSIPPRTPQPIPNHFTPAPQSTYTSQQAASQQKPIQSTPPQSTSTPQQAPANLDATSESTATVLPTPTPRSTPTAQPAPTLKSTRSPQPTPTSESVATPESIQPTPSQSTSESRQASANLASTPEATATLQPTHAAQSAPTHQPSPTPEPTPTPESAPIPEFIPVEEIVSFKSLGVAEKKETKIETLEKRLEREEREEREQLAGRETAEREEKQKKVRTKRGGQQWAGIETLPKGKERDKAKRRQNFATKEEDDFERAAARARAEAKKLRKEQKAALKAAAPKPMLLPEYISVSNLAVALKVRYEEFATKMEELGFTETRPDFILNSEIAGLIAMEYNYEPIIDRSESEDLKARELPVDLSVFPPRPPVVTIMGHVDHGKTTLLDFLRKSSVAATEHGGITQHIGAFSVRMASGKLVTFLDTPGHAAFLSMRQRGANVTDIVILVVAADDSVKPQTIEALKHAQAAKVPIIVAISKVDKDEANIEKVKQDLARYGVEIEDYGGDTQVVCVSGKTGQGMDELEENVVTLAEILDMRAETEGPAEGWVLEASIKAVGKVATVLVRRGTMRPGDYMVAGNTWARIRVLRNEAGIEIEEAGPGTPVEIDGWREQPLAGDEVLQAPTEDKAKSVVDYRLEKEERDVMAKDMEAINDARKAEQEKREREKAEAEAAELAARLGEEPIEEELKENKVKGPKEVFFIIKGDVSGSVEAVIDSISALGNAEVRPHILRSGVGQLSEFDIEHASVAKGHLINFNTVIEPHIYRQAEEMKVNIIDQNIIYRLVDDVKAELSKQLSPLTTQRVLGEADIAQVFEITVRGRIRKNVAGCKVRNGTIGKTAKIRVLRGGKKIFDGTLASLKNVKKDVMEMKKGSECGMEFENWFEFQVGDQVQSYEEKSEKRYL